MLWPRPLTTLLVETLQPAEIAAIYHGYAPGRSLSTVRGQVRPPLVDEELNASHAIVIVASELDPASERIVQYLAERDIAINVLFFRVFDTEAGSCSAAPG